MLLVLLERRDKTDANETICVIRHKNGARENVRIELQKGFMKSVEAC